MEISNMILPSMQLTAQLVPAVWATMAVYLIWGTRKTAPLIYPFGMGMIASVLWLSMNETPMFLIGVGITDDLVYLALLIVATALALEITAHTIRLYDLGHRVFYVERATDYLFEKCDSTVERVYDRAPVDRPDDQPDDSRRER